MTHNVLLHRQLELVCQSIGARARRLQDSLEGLAFFTRDLLRNSSVTDAEVRRWVEEERLEPLPSGFFEQRARVEKLAAGEKCPEGVLVVSNLVKDHPKVLRHFHLLRRLMPHVRQVHERSPGIAWMYFQDASVPHACYVYPGLVPESMIPPDFDWHEYHSFSFVRPDRNPERRIRWSPPNVDYAGEGLISCLSIPVWDGDEFLGVWTMDVKLAALYSDIAARPAGGEGTRQRSFLADYAGRLLAHPDVEEAGKGEKGSVYERKLASLGGDFADLDFAKLVSGGHGELDLKGADGERLFIAYRTIPEAEWIAFTAVPVADMVEASQAAFKRAFARMGSGDLSVRLDAVGDDTMRQLVESYNQMVDTLQETMRRREQAEAENRMLAFEQERLTRELEIAATIQAAMLPRAPSHPDFEFAGSMKPAHEVGGDFYDVLSGTGQSLWITIGDVSSHGLGAGLVMMLAQAAFQSVFESSPNLSADEVLRRVNRLVHSTATRRLGGGRFVTAQLLRYRGAGQFECAGAHLWPLVIDPSRGTIRRIEIAGPWLGVLPELPSIPVSRIEVGPGEVLCLYSDGIIEARNRAGEFYDVHRLGDRVARILAAGGSLNDCAVELLADVDSFSADQEDDRTILFARRGVLPGSGGVRG